MEIILKVKDFDLEVANECFKKIKSYLSKKEVENAIGYLMKVKSTYSGEKILIMINEYLKAQYYEESMGVSKFVDWNYEKSKIQEKIDNFNKKEKLAPLPKVTFSMYDYLKAKREMTSEEQNRYADIIWEMDKLLKIRDEVLNLQIALQNKYFEKKPKNPQNSIFYKIKKMFSKLKF